MKFYNTVQQKLDRIQAQQKLGQFFFRPHLRHSPGSLDTVFGWSKIHVDRLIRQAGRAHTQSSCSELALDNAHSHTHLILSREKNPARL
jgi:hypothetical protein